MLLLLFILLIPTVIIYYTFAHHLLLSMVTDGDVAMRKVIINNYKFHSKSCYFNYIDRPPAGAAGAKKNTITVWCPRISSVRPSLQGKRLCVNDQVGCNWSDVATDALLTSLRRQHSWSSGARRSYSIAARPSVSHAGCGAHLRDTCAREARRLGADG